MQLLSGLWITFRHKEVACPVLVPPQADLNLHHKPVEVFSDEEIDWGTENNNLEDDG